MGASDLFAPKKMRALAYGRNIRLPGPKPRRPFSDQGIDLYEAPLLQKRFRPIIMLLMGRRGQGKTQALTMLGAVMRERFRRNGKGYKVYANYMTSIAERMPNAPDDWEGGDEFILERVMDLTDHSVSDGVLLIDEIQTAMSSRKWNTGVNFGMNQALTQIRKDRLECAFTTQYAPAIDKNVLFQIDLFVECRQTADGNGIIFAVHDKWNQFVDRTQRYKPWPPYWNEADWYWSWWGTKMAFGLYHENQSVVSQYMSDDAYKAAVLSERRRFGQATQLLEGDEPTLEGYGAGGLAEAWNDTEGEDPLAEFRKYLR